MFIDPRGILHQDGAFVRNGVGTKGVGEAIQGVHFDPGLMRPYFDRNGGRYVTVNTGRTNWNNKTKRYEPVFKKVPIGNLMMQGLGHPVHNATVLRKDEWITLDTAVQMAYRQRLRAWDDLLASAQIGGFNGMNQLTYEYEAMSDPGEAVVDMDAMTDARTDNPLFVLRSLPLPITHGDFWVSERKLSISRNRGTPLDTTIPEAIARRIGETIEQTVIGTILGITYGTNTNEHDGTSTVYGYTNYINRNTKTDLNTPSGTNPEAVKQDVIEMREQLRLDGCFGPYMLYYSTGYDAFMDDDYFRSGGTSANTTLRNRILAIEGITDARRLDYLTSGFVMLLIQMTKDVAAAINAMPITTVQWDSQGGLRKNFKIMTIQVPLLRSDYSGRCGIVHATTS